MHKFLSFFFRPVQSILYVLPPEWKEDDEARMKDFVQGHEFKSVEKSLYIRLLQRLEEAGDYQLSDEKRKAAAERKDEVRQIIMEWQHIIEDLTDQADADQ